MFQTGIDVNNFGTDKPYRLTLKHRTGYLYAHVEGKEDSYEISRAYWQEIADECKAHNFQKVLVVEEIAGCGSVAEAYQVSSELPKMGFTHVKVAFVDRYLDQQETNQFAELVAVNRGINGKMFNDEAEAEKWLMPGS